MKKTVVTVALASLASFAPAQASETHDWSGIYGGLYVGSTKAEATWTGVDDNVSSLSADVDESYSGTAADLGGFLGLNFQSDQLLIGVEGNFGMFDSNETVHLDGSEGLDLTSQTESIGSVRARLGYALGESLFYATGGIAMSNFTQTWDDGGIAPQFEITPVEVEMKTGWVAGAGMEYAVTEQVSVRAEALYFDFGSKEGTAFGLDEVDTFEVKQTATSVLVGVAYHF